MQVRRTLGGCVLTIAGACYLLAAFMFLDPLEGTGRFDSLVPGLFFGSVALVPGLWLYLGARAAAREKELTERAVGLVRSHDSFTTDEFARKLGVDYAKAEEEILQVAQREDADLVFHRPDQKWMHRGRLTVKHAVVTKCPSCGAGVGAQVVFEGESVACQYCNQPLVAREELHPGPRRGIPPAKL